MKFLRLLTALAAGMFLVLSCEQPEPEKETVTVSGSPASLSFPTEGGTETISVTSNGLWYAKADGSWLVLSATSGYGNSSVQVSASANAGDARNGQIIFETADQKATVSASQLMYVKPEAVQRSIKEIRALYKGTDYKITDDVFVEGTIISDYRRDTDGGLNNYTSAKTIVISDGEAGLMLYCSGDNKTFARGQKVRVRLLEQTLSVYGQGVVQVNGLPLDNIQYLGMEKPQPKEITALELVSGQYESMYVAVKEVQVLDEDLGKPFSDASANTSIAFSDKDGVSFDLFTSRYATFREEIVPSGSGTLKGIAGKYGARYQISISEKDDYAGLTGARFSSAGYFYLESADRTVSGDAGTFNISLVSSVAWKASCSSSAFSVSPASGTGTAQVTVTYGDNPSASDYRSAVIRFTTEDESVADKELRLTVVQLPFETLVQSEVRPWLEMPAVKEEEGKAFFSHDMTWKDQVVRNYSFWYDLSGRVALWVAYPLYKGMTTGSSRSDKWDYDPIVPRRYQGDASRSYAGYDRGHQLPSADRLCNAAANEQTFYFTNITPQNANLNQGIWETLEAQVRGQISGCDTLYVVTGCVLSTEATPDIDYVKDVQGRDVAVPKAYYKVILKYKYGDPNGGYSAIGFWLENRSYGSQVIGRSNALSVDEIEKRTGFDFFVNLKDDYEKEAESKFDASQWGL